MGVQRDYSRIWGGRAEPGGCRGNSPEHGEAELRLGGTEGTFQNTGRQSRDWGVAEGTFQNMGRQG